ncbi:MAG: molybdenum cofactor biosynthesis protein MoaE [Taibaiella sp.]|nr:molybdenum cofactor biosynthesis protein MoaE [Taibaiella sp.]
MTDFLISGAPLDINACISRVADPKCGGTDVFVGTVRNHTAGRRVLRLEFEAYEKMALLELEKIAATAMAQWPVHKVAIHHRKGTLEVGETAVIIAISAAHSAAAFEACRYALSTLKTTVPIWKKEFFEDGEVWVAAHP